MAKKNKAEAAAPEKKKSKGLLFFLGVLTVVGSSGFFSGGWGSYFE